MFNKERKTSSYEIMEYIIVATLSSFDKETWFRTFQNRNLKKRLKEIYKEANHPIERKNRINLNVFGESLLRVNLDYALSAYTNYGQRLGLTNWGFDYDYKIDSELVVKREFMLEKARKFLGEKDFEFFKELGKEKLSLYACY